MGKEDFRDKIEEHRQTIENEGESKPSRMSRANHNTSGKKKKTKNPLMTVLFIVFIFIPLSILVYVWGFYEPDPVEKKEIVKSKQDVVEVVKNNNAIISKPAATEEEDAQKLAKAEEAKAEAAKAEAAEKIAQEQAAKDAAMLEEQAEAEAKQKAEEEKKKQEANKKTHTVKANETLYRIALNYYGNGSSSGVEKIKKANGMSSETISVGQTLIIPE